MRNETKAQPCEKAENKGIEIEYCITVNEGATNGDVIKAMFPNVKWFINEDDEIFTDHKTLNSERVALARDWWNASYEKESEDKE